MRKTRLSAAVLLLSATFLSTPTIAVSLTPTLGENSTFSYNEGSAGDYNFTLKEADADGKLTTKYYKVDLKPEIFATSPRISWTAVSEDQKDAADVVEIKLPNDQTKYFKYAYAKPGNYTETSIRINDTLALDKVTSVVFKGISASEKGGAVYNGQDYADVDLTADFIGNYASNSSAPAKGGAIYNYGLLGNINGDFVGNHVSGSKLASSTNGGAIYNHNNSKIGDISGDFIENYASVSYSETSGGAVYNNNYGEIGNIRGNFIGNYASVTQSEVSGGAIYNNNYGKIGNITGDFIANYASGFYAMGGALDNRGTLGDMSGDFVGNYALGSKYAYGGAINNRGTLGDMNGDFIGNYVSGSNSYGAYGGAINNKGSLGGIYGGFVGNYALTSMYARGGAIFNDNGNIDGVSGNFVGNYASSLDDSAVGGAVYNYGKLGDIRGTFINNYASGPIAIGGAIDNRGILGNVTGDFIGNYVVSSDDSAVGGAIFNAGRAGNIAGNFIGNYAESTGAEAGGGAVYAVANMNFVSGADAHFMSGNYAKDPIRGKVYNAILGSGTPVITFDTTDGGAWVINDNMESGNYVFKGDDTIDAATGTTTQYIAINNDIINAGTVIVNGATLRFGAFQHEDRTAKNWDGKGAFVASLNADGTANRDADAVTVLSLNNAVFDIANGYLDVVKLKGYSATDSFMHIDVDTDNMKADELHVSGNVEGVTKMIVHASSNADIRGKGEILFAQSENDTTGNQGSFVVSRVYKSPYLFNVKYDPIAANSNKWYFAMNNEENPDRGIEPEKPDVPTPPTPELPDIPVKPTPSVNYRKVAPEVIAYQGLPVAALEQTKGMIGNVSGQINRTDADHTLWANAVYNTLRIKTPTDIDADVWGIEAGGDLQHDLNNKLGLFLSYRKGNYDMNGKGKYYYSTVGSEIDIDSYLAGLYYRYDRNNWWTFATVYGGIQRVDLKTKDGIKSDTDGTEFGGSIELGYDYNLSKTLYLTPSVGAFYTQVDYDDATDSAGKIAKYNTLRQLELEAGIKLTKAFVMDEGYANVYVKPSVVRTLTDGDEVRITGLGKVNTLDDQTLGRVELGGRYGFTEQLSAYGWANHSFGDDYKASTFGLGLSYNW